jgi:hypothetical protein
MLADGGIGYECDATLFEAGDAAVLVPAGRRRRLGRVVYESMPYGTYGGPLLVAGSGLDTAEWGEEIARHFTGHRGAAAFVATPGPFPHVVLPGRPVGLVAQMLELGPPGDPDNPARLLAAMRPKTRQYIRKAERDGVTVISDNTVAAFRDFYVMLVDSARRWRRRDPGKPWSLFESIAAHADSGTTRLWIARIGDRPAAGLLVFYGRGEAIAWSGAMDEALSGTHSNYALHWAVIKDAVERGYDTFSLGAAEGLEGVQNFKSGLGAIDRAYPQYTAAGAAFRLVYNLRAWLRQR